MSRRRPWHWRVAVILNRAGYCWSDLVSWVLDLRSGNRRYRKRFRDVGRQSGCASETDTIRNGCCYCGQIGERSPGERARRERRARRAPFVSAAAVSAVVLGVLATAAAVPPAGPAERVPYHVGPTLAPPTGDLPHVPCEPLPDGGCRWAARPGVTAFVAETRPGPSASLVRRQLADARDGVTPNPTAAPIPEDQDR